MILLYFESMNHYAEIITTNAEIRLGKPCIRGVRISVYDVLGWFASGMSNDDIMSDFPELTEDEIRATLARATNK